MAKRSKENREWSQRRGRELWAWILGPEGRIEFQRGFVTRLETTHSALLVARISPLFNRQSNYVLVPFSPKKPGVLIPSSLKFLTGHLEGGCTVWMRWMTREEVGMLITMGEPLVAVNYQGWQCE